MYNQESYDRYKFFMSQQNYSDMYLWELLEMYADAREYLWGVNPVPDPRENGETPDGQDSAALAEKMIKITNELDARIRQNKREREVV